MNAVSKPSDGSCRIADHTSDAGVVGAGGAGLRAGLPLQDRKFVQFHPTGIRSAGCLIAEGARGEGGDLTNSDGARFMERHAFTAKDLSSRDAASRPMSAGIREGRGCGPLEDRIHLHLERFGADVLHERPPGIFEAAEIFAGIDAAKEPIPILPTVNCDMGGIPTDLHCEVLDAAGKGHDKVVPGLTAVGEESCVSASAHGMDRFGANSLLDPVAFGRAAARRAAETLRPGAAQPPFPSWAGKAAFGRFDRVRHAEDGARAADLRVAVRRTMQAHAAVFRTSEPLCEGIEKMDGMTEGRSDVGLADRPPIWNAGLVEALDLDDLIGDAPTTIRGAHAREDCPERDGRNRPKHALVRMDGNCRVSPDRCGVKMRTPTDGVQVFPPRPRVC